MTTNTVSTQNFASVRDIYRRYCGEDFNPVNIHIGYVKAIFHITDYLGPFRGFTLLTKTGLTITSFKHGSAYGHVNYGIHSESSAAVYQGYPKHLPNFKPKYFLNNIEYTHADWLIESKSYLLENFKTKIIKNSQ